MEEQEIIEQAFMHLQHELGPVVKWKQVYPDSRKAGYDAVFQVDGKNIYVQAKNEVRPAQVDRLQNQSGQQTDVLIAANYITPSAKKLLKECKLNYVDRVGNIQFKLGQIYIHIEGLHNQPPSEDSKNRAFTRTGIKVVFQFIINPEVVNEPYRRIVDATGVGLGTIPKVIEGLKQEGFLIRQTEHEWIIPNNDDLIERWHTEYTKRLKPSLFIKRYRSIDPAFHKNWKTLELAEGIQWGGEPAGDLITEHLKPAVFTVYANRSQQEIMTKCKWVPDLEGDIYVYRKFWESNKNGTKKNHVPSVLVYADLMGTGDSRCVEIAKLIHEQYL